MFGGELSALIFCVAITVTDGESLRCDTPRGWNDVPLRIRALHAPAAGEPGDVAAAAALQALARPPLVCAVVAEDARGRLVVDCVLSDGRDLAASMIRTGTAAHCPALGRPDLSLIDQPDLGPLPPECD